MSTGSFLSGLAARGGAGVIAPLRPDPWRGREETSVDAASEPGAALSLPAPSAVATPLPEAPMRMAAGALATRAMPVQPLQPGPQQDEPATEKRAVTGVRIAEQIAVRPSLAEAEPGLPVVEPSTTTVVHETMPSPGIAATSAPLPLIAQPDAPRVATPALLQPRIRPVEAPPPADAEVAAESHGVEISIGRIEWKAPLPRPVPPMSPAPAVTAPVAGFAAYAALRAGLDRGRR